MKKYLNYGNGCTENNESKVKFLRGEDSKISPCQRWRARPNPLPVK